MIYQLNFNLPRILTLPSFNCTRIACFSSSTKDSNLAKLRKKTGLAFVLCKKALELHNNDLNAAELYLKEESIKHGYAKIQKLKSRRAVQGLVGLFMHHESRQCALLEVNCETDFVARNQNFKQLVAQLTSSLLSPTINKPSPSVLPNTNLATKNVFGSDDLKFFNEQLSQAVIQLGENIKVSRGLILQLTEPQREDLHLFSYVHASGESIADINSVKLGKYGAIIVARQLSNEERKELPKVEMAESQSVTKKQSNDAGVEDQKEIKLTDEEIDNQEYDIEFGEEEPVNYTVDDVGKIICQQIVGLNPIYLKKPEEVVAKEKELMKQGYKIPEDSEYLLDQKTIINPSLSVAEFCDQHGIHILDFVRYECGENIEN